MELTGINENKKFKYIIYEIKCNDENIKDVYIGSTIDFLKRKSVHKCKSKNLTFQNKLYKFIRNNGGWENFDMRPIEIFYCDERMEALIREKEWINKNKLNINVFNNNVECDEPNFYQRNKTEILNKQKAYYNQNKDKILERLKRTYKYIKLKDDNKNILDDTNI